MSKKTWMPLYTADYLADTMHLSTEEHGAYLLLIMHAWLNNGELPADDERLRRITKMDAKSWRGSWSEILRFFYRDGDFYRHKRIEQELQRADDIIDKRSQAGKASAAKRKAQQEWQQTLSTCSTHVQHRHEQEEQQTAIPLPSPSHTEDLGIEPKPSVLCASPTTKPIKGFRLPFTELPDEWREWARKELGWTPEITADIWDTFADYWQKQKGEKALKTKWEATWRNWCRGQTIKTQGGSHATSNGRSGAVKPKHTGFERQDYAAGADGFIVS